jgi:hypothetical protein
VKFPSKNQTIVPNEDEPLPSGTIVDVSNGRGIKLTDRDGDSAVFYGERDGVPSKFVVTNVKGVIELRLIGGNFTSCGKRALSSAGAKKEKPIRRLWGKGKGNFRTKGRYASAAVRGTWWLTADFCAYTLVRVRLGSVTVRDLVEKRTVIVRAPRSYRALRSR